MPKFNNILIVGLGMMGGSLCKSIKKNKLSKKISAYDTDHDALSYALKNKIINEPYMLQNREKSLNKLY